MNDFFSDFSVCIFTFSGRQISFVKTGNLLGEADFVARQFKNSVAHASNCLRRRILQTEIKDLA